MRNASAGKMTTSPQTALCTKAIKTVHRAFFAIRSGLPTVEGVDDAPLQRLDDDQCPIRGSELSQKLINMCLRGHAESERTA
jgi:hypothetical protein